jgi:hypothetical protein
LRYTVELGVWETAGTTFSGCFNAMLIVVIHVVVERTADL